MVTYSFFVINSHVLFKKKVINFLYKVLIVCVFPGTKVLGALIAIVNRLNRDRRQAKAR